MIYIVKSQGYAKTINVAVTKPAPRGGTYHDVRCCSLSELRHRDDLLNGTVLVFGPVVALAFEVRCRRYALIVGKVASAVHCCVCAGDSNRGLVGEAYHGRSRVPDVCGVLCARAMPGPLEHVQSRRLESGRAMAAGEGGQEDQEERRGSDRARSHSGVCLMSLTDLCVAKLIL